MPKLFVLAREHQRPARVIMAAFLFTFYFVNEEHPDDPDTPTMRIVRIRVKEDEMA